MFVGVVGVAALTGGWLWRASGGVTIPEVVCGREAGQGVDGEGVVLDVGPAGVRVGVGVSGIAPDEGMLP